MNTCFKEALACGGRLSSHGPIDFIHKWREWVGRYYYCFLLTSRTQFREAVCSAGGRMNRKAKLQTALDFVHPLLFVRGQHLYACAKNSLRIDTTVDYYCYYCHACYPCCGQFARPCLLPCPAGRFDPLAVPTINSLMDRYYVYTSSDT